MRVVWDETSGNSTRLRQCAGSESCDCTILGKSIMSNAVFLSGLVLEISLDTFLKFVLNKVKFITRKQLRTCGRTGSTRLVLVDSRAFGCLSKPLSI